jgi:hypothetical protein
MYSESNPSAVASAKFATAPTMLDAALAYAERGLRVHPLWWVDPKTGVCACKARGECRSPGKHPLTRWASEATCDEATIRAWWKKRPLAGIGLVTGTGFVVVDLDGELGEASWRALEAVHGAVGVTVEAITGRGRHLFFAVGEGVSLRNRAGLVPGVDVRALGGYVACVPTLHVVGRRYAWVPGRELGTAMAGLPGWLLEELARGRTVAS